MDDDYPRHPGSRVGVLLVGLIIGALVMTGVWVGIAGNPLSDVNEVTYQEITVADVTEARDSICWSDDPDRRDATRQCAILALDPAVDPPSTGDVVVIGVTTLRPTRGEERTQVVYLAPVGRGGGNGEPEPTES
ncbi:MAG TPA: hypothetical protein VM307_00725 [Egibacteraceae bacterium]|nr:hypothetical protein [Egibacteraceae bacterium]